jgi:repressor LexA
MNELLLERLQELADQKETTVRKIADEAGLPAGIVSKWKKGKASPSTKSLSKLSDYLGVNMEYLLGESEFKTDQEKFQHWNEQYDATSLADETAKIEKGLRIPVLGTVPAGVPIEAIEDVLDWEEITMRMAKTGSYFGLKIQGNSMSPRIQNADVVIVRQQPDAVNGDIVIAKINGNEATCKKLIKHKSGITLQPLNPDYDPLYFSNEEMETVPVRIIGKVVELRCKF